MIATAILHNILNYNGNPGFWIVINPKLPVTANIIEHSNANPPIIELRPKKNI